MMSQNLFYSNNTCSAFLAEIVRSFEEHHPKGYLGRTAVQKLAYFAKVLGAPIPCSFDIYNYGPYSDRVTFSMESLMADEVVLDRSAKPGDYSNYRLGPNAAELLSAFHGELEPHRPMIGRLVDALGGFKPKDLELIATLHFIARRQRELRREEPTKENVIREFKDVKHDKFGHDAISAGYDALKIAGLI